MKRPPAVLSPAERRRLKSFVGKFAGKRVLVVGDLMLDEFIRGGVHRISPEAPVPVVQVRSEDYVPGGAGNVARNLASLGAAVAVVGVVGEDAAAERLLSDFQGHGVSVDRVLSDSGRVTSQKCRIIAEHQQVVRFDRESTGPLSPASERSLLARIPEAVASSDAVVLSDYGKGVVTPAVVKAVLAAASRRRLPVTVDPKPENFKLYRRVTCITPNVHEAWAGMRRLPEAGEAALDSLGRSVIAELGCASLLITRGPEGMSLFKRGVRDVVHIPTEAREVFDVTGAGDTVISVLTLGLAAGASIEAAAVIANCAAGIVVAKLGTATVEADELVKALGR
ncbi:MAG: D-glycero-beta-D-manno-heptose-7-phosphate kinase [Elusimicrobiota bacterium]|jgi:D-beta-D-heptose 7-phosphate kinase/D-beta-D-heptose 1-phosphate adenosyltransferase